MSDLERVIRWARKHDYQEIAAVCENHLEDDAQLREENERLKAENTGLRAGSELDLQARLAIAERKNEQLTSGSRAWSRAVTDLQSRLSAAEKEREQAIRDRIDVAMARNFAQEARRKDDEYYRGALKESREENERVLRFSEQVQQDLYDTKQESERLKGELVALRASATDDDREVRDLQARLSAAERQLAACKDIDRELDVLRKALSAAEKERDEHQKWRWESESIRNKAVERMLAAEAVVEAAKLVDSWTRRGERPGHPALQGLEAAIRRYEEAVQAERPRQWGYGRKPDEEGK